MTREEAIYKLKNSAWLGTDSDRDEMKKAIDMAIEALSAEASQNLAEPNKVLKGSDLISRAEAIETVCEECEWERKCHEECTHIETLKALSSASRQTGEWIHGKEISRDYIGDTCTCVHYDKWWCSNCNYTIEYYRPLWKYCPMCGADMRGDCD